MIISIKYKDKKLVRLYKEFFNHLKRNLMLEVKKMEEANRKAYIKKNKKSYPEKKFSDSLRRIENILNDKKTLDEKDCYLVYSREDIIEEKAKWVDVFNLLITMPWDRQLSKKEQNLLLSQIYENFKVFLNKKEDTLLDKVELLDFNIIYLDENLNVGEKDFVKNLEMQSTLFYSQIDKKIII